MRRLLLKLLRRRTMEQDLEAELTFHREMSAAHGNPIPLGNVAVIQEHARDHWRFSAIENLGRDIVYAARGLRRSPSFVAAALLSLALGIGANTAMFSLAVEFLLSEPSVRDPRNVVHIRLGSSSHMKPAALQFLDDSGVFEAVAGQFEEAYVNWDDGQETRRTFAVQATSNFFTALGVPVALGRGWNTKDPLEVVVLSHRFWQKHYAGNKEIVGRPMRLNGRAYTVLGVLPANHRSLVGYGFSPDLYVPRFLPDTMLAAYARLRPGRSLAESRAATHAVAERLDREMPERWWKYASRIQMTPLGGLDRLRLERAALTVALFFLLVLVVVGLVLLIACVNVAGLILARSSARRQEIAIRVSLGASRGRLLQQFMAESLLLSLAGAALGFVLAQIGASSLASLQLPFPIPIHLHIEPDWTVASYAALLAIASTVMTGLLPAWHSVKESLRADLQRDSKSRLRRGLVAAQLAVSLVVLTTGALFIRNLVQSSSLSPGFDVRKTARADVYLSPEAYSTDAALKSYMREGLQSLAAVPGIESAAAARVIPFTDAINHSAEVTFPDTGERKHVRFHWNAVSSRYFETMQIPLLAGGVFTGSEQGAAATVIVNETFAERYLGNRQAVGTTFVWGEAKAVHQIVGVVGNTKNLTIGEDDKAQIYQPLTAVVHNKPRIQFVVKSSIPPALQLAAIREALRPIEPAAAIEVTTLYSSIGLAFLPSQIGAVLMGGIGALGLLLAAVGLSGMMAYSVARRTREIGIRLAIGAGRPDISRMVLRDCATLLLAGSVPGLIIAFFVTRPLAMFLVPGLSPSDPLSFLLVALVLVVTGLLSALGPLRRAVSIDPARCLRYE